MYCHNLILLLHFFFVTYGGSYDLHSGSYDLHALYDLLVYLRSFYSCCGYNLVLDFNFIIFGIFIKKC